MDKERTKISRLFRTKRQPKCCFLFSIFKENVGVFKKLIGTYGFSKMTIQFLTQFNSFKKFEISSIATRKSRKRKHDAL